MVTIPTWQAVTTGYRGTAGHVNQFLGVHNASFIYTGTVRASQTVGNAVYSSTQGTWWSQAFTTATGQTTIGSVSLQLSTVGGSPTLPLIPQLTVSLYATVAPGTVPTGASLVSTTVSNNYIYSAPFFVSIPLPASGLSANTTYTIVTHAVGTSTNYYTWQHSNQVSGAATSTDGVTWSTQPFGFLYQVLDQGAADASQVHFIYEDSSARWTQLSYNTNGTISQIVEQTDDQTTAGYLRSVRNLSYTTGLLTGVS